MLNVLFFFTQFSNSHSTDAVITQVRVKLLNNTMGVHTWEQGDQ